MRSQACSLLSKSVLFDIFLLGKAPKEGQKMNYQTKNKPFLRKPPSSKFPYL